MLVHTKASWNLNKVRDVATGILVAEYPHLNPATTRAVLHNIIFDSVRTEPIRRMIRNTKDAYDHGSDLALGVLAFIAVGLMPERVTNPEVAEVMEAIVEHTKSVRLAENLTLAA